MNLYERIASLSRDNERMAPIVRAAENLVDLWEAQKVSGLPRAERNAAIEGIRQELIDAIRARSAIAELSPPQGDADSIEACIKELEEKLPHDDIYFTSSYSHGSKTRTYTVDDGGVSFDVEGPDPLSAMRAAVEKIGK